MVLQTPPQLPKFIIHTKNNNLVVAEYENIWDPINQRSKRSKYNIVGTVRSSDNLVIWKSSFYDRFPILYECKTTCEISKNKKSKKLRFDPLNELITYQQATELKYKHAGATWLLNNIVANSPLTKALHDVFAYKSKNLKILSLSYYMYMERTSALQCYSEFAEQNLMPYPKPLPSYSITRLLSTISYSEINNFLYKLNKYFIEMLEASNQCNERIFVGFDSTSISTYADLDDASLGYNKDGDTIAQLNILMMVDQKTGMPLYYRTYNGATPDVKTISFHMKEHARLNMSKKFVLVTDRGYFSNSNIDEMLLHNVSFLSNCRANTAWCRQEIIDSQKYLFSDKNYNSYIQCSVYSTTFEWKYPIMHKQFKNQQNDSTYNRAYYATAKVYVHIYMDHSIRFQAELAFKEALSKVLDALFEGRQLNESQEKFKDKYLIINEEELAQKKDSAVEVKTIERFNYLLCKGIRILISDIVSDPIEAFNNYENRMRSEEVFKCFKQNVGARRIRTSTEETSRGKLFIQFIGAGVGCMVRARVSEAIKQGKKNTF